MTQFFLPTSNIVCSSLLSIVYSGILIPRLLLSPHQSIYYLLWLLLQIVYTRSSTTPVDHMWEALIIVPKCFIFFFVTQKGLTWNLFCFKFVFSFFKYSFNSVKDFLFYLQDLVSYLLYPLFHLCVILTSLCYNAFFYVF